MGQANDEHFACESSAQELSRRSTGSARNVRLQKPTALASALAPESLPSDPLRWVQLALGVAMVLCLLVSAWVGYLLANAPGSILPVALQVAIAVCAALLAMLCAAAIVAARNAHVSTMRAHQRALESHQQHLEQVVATRTADLQEQANYLVALIDNFPFGVWLKDAGGHYRAIDCKHAATYRASPEEVIGKTDFDLVADDIAQQRTTIDRDAMTKRRPVIEEQCVTDAGMPGWFETYRAPVLDADGTVVGVVGYSRDISERKALEQAREAALTEANRLAQARSEFLANMSHEIRTPLNAVLGLAQVGVRDNVGRQAVDTFQRILDSGQLLLGVVNDILDFSKIEAGKVELESVAFALGDAIDRAVDLLAQQAYAKGLTLVVDEAPDLPASYQGDPLRVSQVLVNLLSNAVKFTENGQIMLSALRQDDALVLKVIDTGVGMTEEVKARLFRPFEQADGSTTRRYGGTGLGMVITRRLVDLMGGEIRVQSRPNEGSSFEVRLPLAEASTARAPSSARVLLSGLSEAEVEHLSATLSRQRIEAVVASQTDAFSTPSDLVVFSAVGVDQATLIAAGEAIRTGKRVVLVQTPGESDVPLGYLSSETPVIDRPLRVRHIIDALQGQGVRAPAAVSGAHRLQGIRVLAADDSEVNRLVLEDMLKAEGVVLTLVENGRLALERLRADGAEAYDVLLTDIHMPEMDGYETAKACRMLAPDLPVIGVTARAMAEERERCLAAGMVGHVAKPIDLESLIAMIRQHGVRRSVATDSAAVSVLPARERETALDARAALIDWHGFEARYRGRPALIDKLIAASYRNNVDTAARLRSAAACRDFAALAFLAHALKGLAGDLVAEPLHAQAAATEELARQGCDDALASSQQLAQLAEELVVALSKRRKSA
jgi:PAS domain S-box-containing protein